MNRLTINTIDRIIELMTLLSESAKQTPLRLANIGYDIYKEPGLKEYRHMTVGQFLSTVAGYENTPRKLIRIVDALAATTSLLTPGETSLISEASVVKILPVNPNMPFFAQAAEVIDTLLRAMSTLNDAHKENAERLKLSFYEGMDYIEISAATHITRERVRQVCVRFMSDLMEGKVQKELSGEYSISHSFIERANIVAATIENQTIDYVKSNFGEIEDSKLKFIIKAIGLKIIVVDNKEVVVKTKSSYGKTAA